MELLLKWGLPRWLSNKESTCQCKRRRFDPWVRKIPWRRRWQPTAIFLPGKSHRQRSLAGYSPQGHWRVRHHLATEQQEQLLNWDDLHSWKGPNPFVTMFPRRSVRGVLTVTGPPHSCKLGCSCLENGTQQLSRAEYIGLSSSCLHTWILGWPFRHHLQNSGLRWIWPRKYSIRQFDFWKSACSHMKQFNLNNNNSNHVHSRKEIHWVKPH